MLLHLVVFQKLEDLENVESIGSAGVIIGKALYNGALDLKSGFK